MFRIVAGLVVIATLFIFSPERESMKASDGGAVPEHHSASESGLEALARASGAAKEAASAAMAQAGRDAALAILAPPPRNPDGKADAGHKSNIAAHAATFDGVQLRR